LYLRLLQSCDKDFLKGTTINGFLDLSSLKSCDKDFLKGTTINGSLDLHSLQSCDKDFLKGTTINGFLDLSSLQSCDKDFLKGTTINGSLYLSSLQSCDKDFLKGTTINGSLYLSSLQSCDKDFLKGTTINGYLDLSSLKSCDKDFLKGTTINGYLDLSSLKSCDKDLLYKNVKKLKVGYNKKGNYCFFDGILSKVLRISYKKNYTVYITTFGFIIKKGKYTAHAMSIKKGIQDIEFKIISEKLKNTPIKKETLITVKYYRLITGACDLGCRNFMDSNKISYKVVDGNTVELSPIKACDLLKLLEKSNSYGLDKFKKLITF
jgi:hypothetical protein